ncbi:MAG: hypothetical protein J0M19_04220 [Sphingomonadales bacterium]|nr:hypothetical protein [Sphingomonadales bacterium]
MNDNGPQEPEREIFDILESFAPNYQAALSVFVLAREEVTTVKLSIAAGLTACWTYVIFHASNIDQITAMAAYVSCSLAIGLWRILKLEDDMEKAAR